MLFKQYGWRYNNHKKKKKKKIKQDLRYLDKHKVIISDKQKYSIAADFDMLTRLIILENVDYTLIDSILVRMRTGGLSNSGLRSLILGTKEICASLRENGIYSNFLMVLVRMPFKFITQTVKISSLFGKHPR